MLLAVLAAVAALAFVLMAAALAANRVPLTAPPGAMTRLAIYLGSNVAETGADARLPELSPIMLRAGALPEAVAEACRALDWHDVRVDAQAMTVDASVRTRWLRFTDDVRIRLVPAAHGLIEARVRAASRIGRGDLGANAKHVMDLRAALERAGLVVRAAP